MVARQQAGHDVGLLVLADRDESVHLGHALALEQVGVRPLPVQDQGVAQLARDLVGGDLLTVKAKGKKLTGIVAVQIGDKAARRLFVRKIK